MNTYRIDWSTTVEGEYLSVTVEVMDRTMNAHLARQYAMTDLFDHYDVDRARVDVNDIQVDWERVDR